MLAGQPGGQQQQQHSSVDVKFSLLAMMQTQHCIANFLLCVVLYVSLSPGDLQSRVLLPGLLLLLPAAAVKLRVSSIMQAGVSPCQHAAAEHCSPCGSLCDGRALAYCWPTVGLKHIWQGVPVRRGSGTLCMPSPPGCQPAAAARPVGWLALVRGTLGALSAGARTQVCITQQLGPLSK
jgi:hypothetical protein